MINIIIDNCQDCPFCNQDIEFGADGCNLDSYVNNRPYQMPNYMVHIDCHLSKDDYEFKLKHE